MRSLRAVILASAVGLFLAAGGALVAGAEMSPVEVTATTVDACTLDAPTELAFGMYNPSVPSVGEANIVVTCSLDVPYQIGLGDGNYQAPVPPNRRLYNLLGETEENYLFYWLYKDAARTVPWGDGGSAPGCELGDATAPCNDPLVVGTGSPVTHTVYGRIPAGQYSRPAGYIDQVQVVLTW